jgi:P27 family predicted phage terminase small subunit
MSGPAPLPKKIHQLHGNPGRRPFNKNQPEPPVKIPKPPIKLSKIARRHWKYVVPLLEDMGVLSSIDSAALAAYCQTFQQWDDLENIIKEDDKLSLDDPNKLSLRDRLSVGRSLIQIRNQMRMMLAEFGMTPASRGRVSVLDYKKPLDEFEMWEKESK